MRTKLLAVTFGIFLAAGTAYAGPLPGGPDTDGDLVEDAFDNCKTVANPTQVDTDHDACGQFCDFDFNNTGTVDISDVTLAAGQFTSPACSNPVGSCVCDYNMDGNCAIGEVTVIAGSFTKKPGPSGITTAQCNTALCQCTPAP